MDRDALFFENGEFAAPLHVANIEDVPESHRDWYAETGKGGEKSFRLRQEIWTAIREPFENKMDELEQNHADEMARLQADVAKSRADRQAEQVSTVLSSALKSAGVGAGLVSGAIALLRDSNRFEVELSYDGTGIIVMAQTPTGLHSVDALVANFLESDEGSAFVPKRAAPNDAYFATLVAGLKQRR